jgi:hypothetical protein
MLELRARPLRKKTATRNSSDAKFRAQSIAHLFSFSMSTAVVGPSFGFVAGALSPIHRNGRRRSS